MGISINCHASFGRGTHGWARRCQGLWKFEDKEPLIADGCMKIVGHGTDECNWVIAPLLRLVDRDIAVSTVPAVVGTDKM